MTKPPVPPNSSNFLLKWGLFAAAFLVVGMATMIFWRAATFQNLGIQANFGLKVLRVDTRFFVSPPETWPAVDDHLLAWNQTPLASWPQWVDLLDEMPKQNSISTVTIKFQRATDQSYGEVQCHPVTAPWSSLVPSALWLLLKLALFSLGILVYWKQPESRFTYLFFWMTLLSVGAYMGGYHWLQIVNSPILLTFFVVSASLLMPVSTHFFLRFPSPHPWIEQYPKTIKTLIYTPPCTFLTFFFINWFLVKWLETLGVAQPELANAFERGLGMMLRWIYAYIALSALYFLGGWIILFDSLWRAKNPTEKSQIRWVLAGMSAALLPVSYSLWLSFSPTSRLGSGENTWSMLAASTIVTIAFGISLTRYRLHTLEAYLGGGVNMFLVSSFASFFYYALVFGGMVFVGMQVAEVPSPGQILAVSGTALVLVILVDLTRGQLLSVVLQKFRQQRRQLDETLQEMHQVVDRLVDPNTLAKALLRHATQVVEVKRGAIYLMQQSRMELVVHQGGESPPSQLVDETGFWDRLARVPFISLESQGSPAAQAHLSQWKQHLVSLGMGAAVGLRHEGKLRGVLYLGTRPDHSFPEDLRHLVSALAQITSLALVNGEEHRQIESLGRELQTKVDQIAKQQQLIHSLQAQLTRSRPEPKPIPESEEAITPNATEEARSSGSKARIIGRSSASMDLMEMARKVAPSSSAVLLRGESGTGKEVLAEWIHERSPRANKPFIKVHCAALAPGLLESELFGHVKGAFTNAHKDKPGRFELADGGTLFLDEIGDISSDVQTKLLRVLQERTFERVGSNESIQVDVRIIAATHRNLEDLMEKGGFRRDLFYRLNVFPIHLPPLRDRQIDIPELAVDLLARAAEKSGIPTPQMDDDVLTILKSQPWQGNIRELQNVLERALVLSEGGMILPRHLSAQPGEPDLGLFMPSGISSSTGSLSEDAFSALFGSSSEKAQGLSQQKRKERLAQEKEKLVRAISVAGGNKSVAARNLGIPRSTLVSRMRRLGLE